MKAAEIPTEPLQGNCLQAFNRARVSKCHPVSRPRQGPQDRGWRGAGDGREGLPESFLGPFQRASEIDCPQTAPCTRFFCFFCKIEP